MRRRSIQGLPVAVLVLCLPVSAFAQRELHWDALSVAANLDADGILHVAETHAMVFTGDWNGGERTFDIRPRQTLSFDGMSRWSGVAWQVMTRDADLDGVDDYAFTDGKILRWRSRLPSDPPFNRTTLRYELRYRLSNILQRDGDGYVLNHDFAFPDRVGVIDRFELRLTLDPAWQVATPIPEVYAESGLAPGRSVTQTIPLRYRGSGTPAILDLSRPFSIRLAVLLLFGLTTVSVAVLFLQEYRRGRFASIETTIDEAWLREHILKFPAELVSAAWDDSIGPPEVVALLARLTSEGKLASDLSGGGTRAAMTLHLKVSRSKLTGYERTLIDKLFFGERSTTSIDAVKAHYKKKGFDPVGVIKKDLESDLKSTFPFAEAPRKYAMATSAAFVAGLLLLIGAWTSGPLDGLAVFLLFIGSGLVGGLGSLPGSAFRQRLDWGYRAAALCLIPACTISVGTAAFLWWYAGTGAMELSGLTIAGSVALAFGAISISINALRSRQTADGIAFRKTLAAGRMFFVAQLRRSSPALRDEWYPWLLAFELDPEMTDWSVRHATISSSGNTISTTSFGSSSSSHGWSGFGGGRSGGAGAGTSWAAAAGGFAASVAPPSSGGSGGGSSGGGGGGGGRSSSGGGGGGGW